MLQLGEASGRRPREGGREARKYLSFQLGEEHYAVAILGVKEIIEYEGVTAVPRMPAFIRGVINLRGRVVPVVDLAVRLEREPVAVSRRTCIVILEVMSDQRRLDVGIVVDGVRRVLDLDESALEAAPSLGGQLPTEFIHGMAEVEGRFVIVLDMDRVFSLGDLRSLVELGPTEGHAQAVA